MEKKGNFVEIYPSLTDYLPQSTSVVRRGHVYIQVGMVESIDILGVHTKSTIGPTLAWFDVGAQTHFVDYSQKSLTFPSKILIWRWQLGERRNWLNVKFFSLRWKLPNLCKYSKFCNHFKNCKILCFQFSNQALLSSA